MKKRLTLLIVAGMLLGVVVGCACHSFMPASQAEAVAGYFSTIAAIFLRLIAMIIAPLVFATLVSGLAGMHGANDAGRIGLRVLGWFVCASFVSLALGLVFANVLHPGAGLHLSVPAQRVADSLATKLNVREFIVHIVPTSLPDAMARNDILQILVFAIFLGFALSSLKNEPGARLLTQVIDALVPVVLRVTSLVMCAAPLGVFGAIAAAVTLHGTDVLLTYGRLIVSFYIGLLALWAVLIVAGYFCLGTRVFALLKTVRAPALLGFSTASSEAAYPGLVAQLEKFGIDRKLVGFTLPLGYAFNLGGSMMYQAFAAIFIAQAFDISMPVSQQIFMLLVLMLSSKGMAGVPRGAVVAVAAVAPMFHLPAAGIALVLAVDHILDMGRTLTNIIGNSIATAVIGAWDQRNSVACGAEPRGAVAIAQEEG